MALGLTGCFINDPPPCTIQDDYSPEAVCNEERGIPFTFKVEYNTADGTRPDGRYGFFEASGLNQSEAEASCKSVLQNVFNSSRNYIDFEAAEIQYYRGNICGDGFRMLTGLRDIKVKRVRKISHGHFDYDLEITCVAH